jgi:protein tyrosine phosphatase (PTP) superfamily phosphohydrolase (DUF442 family)
MTARRAKLARAIGLALVCAAGCCAIGPQEARYPPAPGCDHCSSGTPATARLTPTPAGPGLATVPGQPTMPPGAEAGVRLAPPETIAAEPPRDKSRYYPPRSAEPPVAAVPPTPREGTAATPTLPDIPQFAIAKKGVAAGQQPFSDGVTWLKQHGYRTVLHVRPPEDTGTAAKQIFEQRGLKYVSLQVSPATLSRDVIDQFNRVLTDAGNQPLFVFDRDGALAGGLWYLHFRLVDGLSDARARAEAARLGFREDGAHLAMWLAVQKYLRDLNP